MSEKYIFCLTPRCGFCSFRFEEGDDIVAMRKTGMAVLDKFRFSRMASIRGIVYVACANPCWHKNERAFGCHPKCLEMVPFRLRSAVVKAISYQYEPPRTEDKRRLRWLRSSWSTILFMTFRGRFPLEICEKLAQNSLGSFATRRALTLFEKPQQPESCFISLSTKVWVRYIHFEGVRYIQSITNEQPPDGSAAVQLAYDPTSVAAMFVGEDHLGVRELLFTSSSEKPAIEEQSNVWWRTVRDPNAMLEAKTNGARLLSLTSPAESRAAKLMQLMSWTTPPFERLWYYPCDCLLRLSNSDLIQMTAVRVNDPGVTGYSVCCTLDLVAVHAHSPNEDTEFYRQNESVGAVWQYMPIDKDETLVEIWKIEGWHCCSSKWALAFRTSKNRVAILGAWPWAHPTQTQWTLVHQPRQQPSRLFYESSHSRTRLLAFERGGEEEEKESRPPPDPGEPPPPPPTTPRPASPPPLEAYFYSSATLDGVTAVTPCWCRVGGVPVTRGLLLHHATDDNANERGVSCVGEVRLHALGARLELLDGGGGGAALWLGFADTALQGPSVTRIATSRPVETETEGVTWYALPCKGRLEWWFSFRQCRVYHEGRASPEGWGGPVLYRDSAVARSSVRAEW